MKTRHSVEGPLGREFPAICNHCGVMTAWICKTWKFCKQFLRFLGKTIPLKLSLLRGSRPKSARASPHIWLNTVLDFVQIGSLSAELLPNAWRPFLPVEYLQYRLLEPIMIGSLVMPWDRRVTMLRAQCERRVSPLQDAGSKQADRPKNEADTNDESGLYAVHDPGRISAIMQASCPGCTATWRPTHRTTVMYRQTRHQV